jgi:hypothetical protein
MATKLEIAEEFQIDDATSAADGLEIAMCRRPVAERHLRRNAADGLEIAMCRRMISFYETTARELEQQRNHVEGQKTRWVSRLAKLEKGEPTRKVGVRARKGAIKTAILSLLQAGTRGLSSSEINVAVGEILPSHNADAVRVALHRLRNEGKIRKEGGGWRLC